MRGLGAALGLAALLSASLMAHAPFGRQFASGVTLVEVYASVTDARGGPVTDLSQRDFKVLEDGVEQPISAFASGDFPLSVALAIDHSWSMAGERLRLARTAARTFLQQLRANDRAMLIAVSSSIDVIAPLSNERGAALEALANLQPWSTTALNDAVIASIDLIQPASGRRALILLSDGIDRYSKATAADALDRARRSDVLIYPIAFGRNRPGSFAELAVQTGALSYSVQDPRDLEKTFSSIANDLRHQYLIGYTPLRPADPARPAWRSIQVKVSRSDVRVRARDGYFAK